MAGSPLDDARSAVTRGVDAAGQFGAAAAEVVRARREPAAIAERQVTRARRRVVAWSAAGLASAAWVAFTVTGLVRDGVTASGIVWLIVALALLAWIVPQDIRAVRALRRRTRFRDELPPRQPSRPTVAAVVRKPITRLGQLSDGLRSVVDVIGWVPDEHTRTIRRDLITAADAAEVKLRREAAAASGMVKSRDAGSAADRERTQHLIDQLVERIEQGVAEYARLVAAATEIASLSSVAPGPALTEQTERLQALSLGMREIAGPDRLGETP